MALYLGKNKVSLNSVVRYTDTPASIFYTNQKTVQIKLKGTGKISIVCDNTDEKTVDLFLDKYSEITFPHTNELNRAYAILNIDNITELDLSNNSINKFVFTEKNNIQKLILNHNDLSSLNCQGFKNIQFLHMFDNPMCDSLESMQKCVESLPNRTGKAMGSIIFYPWYGLETLIEKKQETIDGVEVTKYYKYPYLSGEPGNINHPENPNRHYAYDSEGNYKFYNNKLYGIVSRIEGTEQIQEYCKYNGSELEEYELMNNHHLIRKKVEAISLPKNYAIGSAIMYSDEWDNMPFEFKQSHIADIWETAEKGFGQSIGVPDYHLGRVFIEYNQEIPEAGDFSFAGQENNFSFDSNVISFADLDGKACQIHNIGDQFIVPHNPAHAVPDAEGNYSPYVLAANQIHGDQVLSHIVGRGHTNVYGFVPNAKISCVRYYSKTTEKPGEATTDLIETLLSTFEKTNNIVSASLVWSEYASDAWRSVEQKLKDVASSLIYISSAGNSGDDYEYTEEETAVKKDSSPFIHLQSNVGFLVGAVSQDLSYAPFPCSNPDISNDIINDPTPHTRYMIHYGSSVTALNSLEHKLKPWQGTSASAPICSGHIGLLRSLYSKLYNNGVVKNDKKSPFLDYMFGHWINPMMHLTDIASGVGMPDALSNIYEMTQGKARKYIPDGGSLEVKTTIDGTKFTRFKPIKFEYKNIEAFKTGLGIKDKRSQYIISKNNFVYPVVSGAISVDTYSKSSFETLKHPKEYSSDTNVYAKSYNTYNKPLELNIENANFTYIDPFEQFKVDINMIGEDYVPSIAPGADTDRFTIFWKFTAPKQDVTTTMPFIKFGTGGHIRSISYKIAVSSTTPGGLRNAFRTECSVASSYTLPHQKEWLTNTASTNLTEGQEVTMALTSDGSTMQLYFDGQHIGQIYHLPNEKYMLSDITIDGVNVKKSDIVIDGVNVEKADIEVFSCEYTPEEVVERTIYLNLDKWDTLMSLPEES